LSDTDGVESELSDSEQLQIMMELQYKRKKKWRKRLKRDPKVCMLFPLHVSDSNVASTFSSTQTTHMYKHAHSFTHTHTVIK